MGQKPEQNLGQKRKDPKFRIEKFKFRGNKLVDVIYFNENPPGSTHLYITQCTLQMENTWFRVRRY